MSTDTTPVTWPAGHGPPPTSSQVRDDQQRVWSLGADGIYHTADNRHHETPDDLHRRTDLVEVVRRAHLSGSANVQLCG